MTNTMRGRFRMEWLLLVAGLLTVGLVIGASLYKEHADIDRRERERFSTQAQVVEKSVGGVLDVVNRALIGIRDDLPGWRAEKDGMAHASQRLRAFADAMRSVRTLQVLDSEGMSLPPTARNCWARTSAAGHIFRCRLPNPTLIGSMSAHRSRLRSASGR